MSSNVEFYKQLEQRLKDNFEAQYISCLYNGEVKKAYEILGELMKYKLISKFDERLSEKNKTFIKAGILKGHRFQIDLRKDTNYIPEWIYADIPHEINTVLISKEHIGERRDFGYLVDITLPERQFPVRIKLETTPMSAKRELEALAETYKQETGKVLGIKGLTEEVYVGCARIYNIHIDTTVLDKYKNIGSILVYKSAKDNRFKAKIVLKSKALKYYFIDIKQALVTVKESIARGLNLGDQIDIGIMVDYRKAMLEQIEIIKKNNVRLAKMKFLQKNNIRTWEQVEEMEKRASR